jgi:hypothetical protein
MRTTDKKLCFERRPFVGEWRYVSHGLVHRVTLVAVRVVVEMGFGSYDESEQENQQRTTDDEDVEAVNVHEHDHDGEVTVEGADSTDELVDRLQDLK